MSDIKEFDESLNDPDFKYRYNLDDGVRKGRLVFLFSILTFLTLWGIKG